MTTKINTSKAENIISGKEAKGAAEPVTINNNIFLELTDRMPKAYSMNL